MLETIWALHLFLNSGVAIVMIGVFFQTKVALRTGLSCARQPKTAMTVGLTQLT